MIKQKIYNPPIGMYSPCRLYACWRLQHWRYTGLPGEVTHQALYQYIARLCCEIICLPFSKFMHRQSRTIGIIIPGKDTQRPRPFQVNHLSPERAGITTFEGLLGNHYLTTHFPGPGIELLNMYPQ